ncbi:MAG: hypothetical protein ACLP62_01345 [Acidimicrobiales bacterium]
MRPKVKTPEELAEAMAKVIATPDTQGAHYKADLLMARQLRALGYGRAMNLYATLKRWFG